MNKIWPASFGHEHTPEAIEKRLAQRRRPSLVRDLVYGAIDGTVTTFSIVAGVSGADLPNSVILILGLSNVLSDGFSMAAGNYLGTKAEQDEKYLVREFELEQIIENPAGETEEIRQIFKAKGFEGELLDKTVEKIIKNREQWLKTMLTEEYGLGNFEKSPLKAGLYTFLAFVAFGLIPMFPFALALKEDFIIATVLTGLAFFLLGALKSIWSLESIWISGMKTFVLGTAAAGLAYTIGVLLKDNVG